MVLQKILKTASVYAILPCNGAWLDINKNTYCDDTFEEDISTLDETPVNRYDYNGQSPSWKYQK